MAVAADGTLYVADAGNHTIRKIAPDSPLVTTLAGATGHKGTADGLGSAARFNLPHGVAVAADGTLYVADTFNHTIRKMSPAGNVTTLAGLAGHKGSVDGPGAAARFYYPAAIAVDAEGAVYVADNGNQTIRKISPTGAVTTLAGAAGRSGYADGPGPEARFRAPTGLAVDASGNVYVVDHGNFLIRQIAPSGEVSTLASSGTVGYADGTGTAAQFNNPSGVVVDGSSNVYVADSNNQRIRKIVVATGEVSTLAGSTAGYADGTGAAAQFNNPTGVTVDRSGTMYVADTGNNRIRVVK